MNLRLAPTATSRHSEQLGYFRLHGRWPLVMRGIWVISLALTLAATLATFPFYLTRLGTPCTTPICGNQHLTPTQFALLGELGITPTIYVAITVALAMSAVVVCWTLSALIIWRRPDDWMAALVAILLIASGPLPIMVVGPGGPTRRLLLNGYFINAQLTMLAVVFSLFPSGRFAPRWTRWVLVGGVLVELYINVPPSLLIRGIYTPPGIVGFEVAIVQMVALAAIQIFRYRRISTPLQRQQTKWVIIGLTAPVLYYAGLIAGVLFRPDFFAHSPIGVLLDFENAFLLPLFLALGFALAMLRYRLWEIDHLINRALVYGTLTLILTGLYAGLVIGLQALARGLIGQNNSIVIVLSTLVIAALVLPLRRGLQTLIDRQFYRHKYDAARTLQAFSVSLRHEFQVEALREQLLRVVEETMRPAHVSLWLRTQPLEGRRVERP
jgi:hypothetical protein